jgi:ferredoxin
MGHRIYVEGTNISFYCAEDEAVFRAMLRAGKGPLRYGCCGGGCGVCRMKIVSGKWAGFKSMSAAHVGNEDKKEGIVLLCCVQPKSDLVIAKV